MREGPQLNLLVQIFVWVAGFISQKRQQSCRTPKGAPAYCSFGTASTTLSSTATVGVNSVALFLSASAICFAVPLIAGPAGFVPLSGASPGIIEIRVVFGVQFAVPRQVSRINTCRNPLFGAACTFAAAPPAIFDVFVGVMATNATYLPVELIEGKMLSVPFNAPCESVETSVVAALHVLSAPMHVSCT